MSARRTQPEVNAKGHQALGGILDWQVGLKGQRGTLPGNL